MIIYTLSIERIHWTNLEMISPEMEIKGMESHQSPIKLPFYFLLQFFNCFGTSQNDPNTSAFLVEFIRFTSLVWKSISGKKY